MNSFSFKELFLNFYDNNFTNNTSFEAAQYALNVGGKRFRFALSMDTAIAYGVDNLTNSCRLAVAVELIHNYSLIHDDLPCMDDSDERRGQPSCQKKFGEAQAVLAGDGLLNCAGEVLFGGDINSRYLKSAEYLFNCAGFKGMIYGQSIDVKNQKLTFEDYIHLAQLKTSKLICASVVPQAILANAQKKEIELLDEFCYNLGLIYQFADDICDKNEDEQKTSILSFFDKKNAIKFIVDLQNKATDVLKNLQKLNPKINFDFLNKRMEFVLNNLLKD